MNQADWDLYIKSAKASSDAYQSYYANKRKEEDDQPVFSDNTPNNKSKVVKNSKDFWESAADFGKGVVAATQQGAGAVADTAIQAKAIQSEIKNQLSLDSQEVKTKRTQKIIEESEKMRKALHKVKDVTGNKIAGTSAADEAARDIATGRGDAEDFGKVGLTGLNVGASATMFANPVVNLTKTAVQSALKTTGKNILNNAIVGAVGGGAEAGANDRDVLTGALYGGTGGAVLSGGAEVLGRAFKGKKATKVEETTPQEVIPESRQIEAPTQQNLIGEGTRVLDTAENIKSELKDVQNATGRYANATSEERIAKFQELRSKLDTAIEQESRTDFTMPSRTLEEVSDNIDAIGKDGIATEAVKPAKDFETIDEVASHPNIPSQLRGAAAELKNELDNVNRQKMEVMTRERADEILDEFEVTFNERADKIDRMPEPRRSAEMDRLQTEYEDFYDNIEGQVLRDKEISDSLIAKEQQINANIGDIITDANLIKNQHPTEFGEVDTELNNKLSQDVEKQTETAIFNRMNNSDGTPDAENIHEAWTGATDEKIDANLNSPEVGDLTKESLLDTFENEGVKIYGDNARALDATYTGLALSSASHNLSKLFGKAGDLLFGKIVRGYAHVNTANKDVARVLTLAKKAFGGDKELYSKAVDVLEGKDIDTTNFTPAQVEAVKSIRNLYDIAKNQVRKLAYNDIIHVFEKRHADGNFKFTGEEIKQLAKRDGISNKEAIQKYSNLTSFSNKDIDYLATQRANNSTLDNYYPHMFDGNGKEVDFIENDFLKTNGTIKFGNILHRASNSEAYSRDIIDVSARYFSALNKKTFLEPALQELDNAKLAVKIADSDASPVYQWLDKYQEQLKYNKQDDFGKSWNELVDRVRAKRNPNDPKIGQNHYRSLLSSQRQINALAALGLSFRNAIQQTTQIGTTIGNIGVKDTTVGMMKYLKQAYNPATRKQYRDMLSQHGITHAGIAKEAYSELLNDGVGGKFRSFGEKMSDGLMIMTSTMDEFARAATYEGVLHSNLKNGMAREEAESLATAAAAKYNFLTSKVDMPVKLNSDTVRSLSQFMTFSYKQAEAWKDLGIKAVKNPETGKFQVQPKEMGRLVQMAVFYGLAFEGMSQLAGIDPEDNIPFYGNIVGDSGLPKSPIISILAGRENQPGLIEIVQNIANPEGSNSFEKEENRNAMMEKLTDLIVRNFVPAGSQGKKSLQGFESTQNEGVVSKDGQVRFMQNTDDASKLKATLFGQYSTEAGREWIAKKFPTLSEKQSEILNSQKSMEAKQKAYDFFTGLKDIKVKSSAKQDIESAYKKNPTRAMNLIDEHNNAVETAKQNYINKYGELSDYENEYLKDNYYITYKNIKTLGGE